MKNSFEQPQHSVPQDKKDHWVERIITRSPEDEQKIKAMLLWYAERLGKTPHQVNLKKIEKIVINDIRSLMPSFLAQFGARYADIPTDRYVKIDVSEFSQDEKRQYQDANRPHGKYHPQYGAIALYDDRNFDILTRTTTIVHELMHAQAFQSLTAKFDTDENNVVRITDRRGGMIMQGEKNDERYFYFNWLNEAITEELARRFAIAHFRDISSLSGDMNVRKEKFPDLSEVDRLADTFLEYTNDDGTECAWGKNNTYSNEREKFNEIIDQIMKKFPDRFADREAVFDVFARAYFNGRILPIARLIDDAYGKGSFARLARESKKECSSEHGRVLQILNDEDMYEEK